VLLALAALVSYWYGGFGLGGNDEGALLTAAGKILRGGVFYRDIDAYPFPASHYLLAAAMSLFGEHLSVARALAGVVYCGIVITLYACALPLLGRRSAALFGASLLAFKFLAWPAFTAFFYWDLALLGASGAWAALSGPRGDSPVRWTLAGLATGFAFFAKQSLGAAVIGALLVLALTPAWLIGTSYGSSSSARRRVFALGAGFAIIGVPLLGWFAWQGLLVSMAESGLLRPFTSYAGTSGFSFTIPLRWWDFGTLQGTSGFSYYPVSLWLLLQRKLLPVSELLPLYWTLGEIGVRAVYTSIPIAGFGGLALLVRPRLARRPIERGRATAVLMVAAITASAFPRADFAHVISVYPAILLLLFLLAEAAKPRLALPLRTALKHGAAAIVMVVIALCAALTLVNHGSMTSRIELSRASLRVHPDSAYVGSVVNFIEEVLAEDEPLFVYGHEAYFYFLTGRYSPWTFSQLYPGQSGEDGGRKLASILSRDPPLFVIEGFLRFPGVPALPDYAPILHHWIERHYEPDSTAFDRYPPAGPLPMRLRVLRLRNG
jgi:hypothetical protein